MSEVVGENPDLIHRRVLDAYGQISLIEYSCIRNGNRNKYQTNRALGFGGGSGIQESLGLALSGRRGPTEIITEILATASGSGVTKTSLVYKTNLNFTRIEKYIEFLTRKDLISRKESDSSARYVLTEKGKEALRLLSAARTLLSSDIPLS